MCQDHIENGGRECFIHCTIAKQFVLLRYSYIRGMKLDDWVGARYEYLDIMEIYVSALELLWLFFLVEKTSLLRVPHAVETHIHCVNKN